MLRRFGVSSGRWPNRATLQVQRLDDRIAPSVSAPNHLYTFESDLADQFGGPSLVADGGTVASGRYTFAANQGLRLLGGLANTSTYSVAMSIEIDALSPGFKKLIDFQERNSDAGIYVVGARLALYPGTSGPTSVSANSDFQVVLARDGSTGITTLYLNGLLQATFSGSVSGATVPGKNVLTFFEDDRISGFKEAVGGSTDFIAVYDHVLSAADAAELAAGATTVQANQSMVTVPEGTQAANTGAWNNAAFRPVTLSASMGTVTQYPNGTWSWSLAAQDGHSQQPVTITASTAAGGIATTFQLVVTNVAPNVSATSNTVSVAEGDVASNGGLWSDVVADTVTLSASIGSITTSSDGTWSWIFAAQDGPDESQTVTVTATDNDGATSTVTFQLFVTNIAPTVSALTASSNTTGDVTLGGAFTDPGLFDTHMVAVNWGDGTAAEALATVDQAADTFACGHHYAKSGTFSIIVTVTDNNGASVSATTTATVAGVLRTGLIGDILYVVGSDSDDHIRIETKTRGNSHETVFVITTITGLRLPRPIIQSFTFNASDVRQIVVMSGAGNDFVFCGNDLNVDIDVADETGTLRVRRHR